MQYTVEQGENLYNIAYRYHSKVSILMKDNPFIKNPYLLEEGMRLQVRTVHEYSREQSHVAAQQSADSVEKNLGLLHLSEIIPDAKFKNQVVRMGQIGTVEILKETPMLRLVKDGAKLLVIRDMNVGETHYVFGSSEAGKKLWLIGPNEWVSAGDKTEVRYTQLPEKLLEVTGGNIESAPPARVMRQFSPLAFSVAEGTVQSNVKETSVASGEVQLPSVWNGASQQSPQVLSVSPKLAAFEQPNYRRPVLRVKRDSTTINMEMRVLNVAGSYSNSIQSTKTNGGWFFNLAGANLSILNISGYWLDTKTNREFDKFLEHYKKYIEPYKSGSYYSMAICDFYYKERLYKGLIANFNYSDRQEESLHRKFQLQFMVLYEKSLSSGEISETPYIHNREGKSETEWLSDINNVIKNPIG